MKQQLFAIFFDCYGTLIIEPATRLGVPTVLVDRQGGSESASGAGTGHARPGLTLRSLAELADRLLGAE